MTKHKKIRHRTPRKPFGMLCGILATCLAIAIGLASGLDPYTICFRASICGIAFGISVRVFVDFIRIANIPSAKVKESQ